MPLTQVQGGMILPSTTLTTPIVATTLGVGGATPSTSGAGITFPATQSASSDANTLDDYEEGTFTPSFGASTTNPTITYLSETQGKYTKIGNVVYVNARVTLNTYSGGSGNLELRGLPFTVSSNSQYPSLQIGFKQSWVTNGPDYARTYIGTTYCEIYKSNNTGETIINVTNAQAGVDCIFNGFYYTA
jgi:hypothetical protein